MTLIQRDRGADVADVDPGGRSGGDSGRQARFAAVFDECAGNVFAYARRHTSAEDARDVVSETFLVAWRRFDSMPVDPLPWLLVVARNTVSNLRRTRRRHPVADVDDLAETLDRLAPRHGLEQSVVERGELLAAVGALTELEREALLLVAWDGLTNQDAAAVAGCSTRAFEVRLSRARARLTRELDSSATNTDVR